MRARIVVRILGLVVFIGLALTFPAWGATKNVTMQNISYNPRSLTVSVGDKVTWAHADGGAPHSVTAHGGQADSFDSNANCPPVCMVSGDVFSHVFNKAGTFTYYCRVHGDANSPNCDGMCGNVVVMGASPPQPTAAATQAPGTQAPAASTATPHVQEAAPLTATPLGLPALTPPPTAAPGETVRPFGTPLAAKNATTSAGRGPIAGLAIAAVLVSTVAAVATWLRYGRPPF